MIISLMGIPDNYVVWLAEDEEFDNGDLFYVIIMDYDYALIINDDMPSMLHQLLSKGFANLSDRYVKVIAFDTINKRDEYIKSRGWDV
jgi:hypothetical protein